MAGIALKRASDGLIFIMVPFDIIVKKKTDSKKKQVVPMVLDDRKLKYSPLIISR